MTDTSSPIDAERWRALRGSPPSPPSDECFAVLAGLSSDERTSLATDVGENAMVLDWWAEIVDHPSRPDLWALRPTQIVVYREIASGGPLTDDELVERLQMKKGSVSPRRKELTSAGLVAEAGRKRTDSGRTAAQWAIVGPEEVQSARERAAKQGPRRRKLTDYPLEQRVHLAKTLLRMDDVNDVLVAEEGRSKDADRVRRSARSIKSERDRARREHSERIRRAERDASPQLLFLKAVRQLRSAGDAVREVTLVIEENRNDQLAYGESEIAADDWPQVRTELRQIIELSTAADTALGSLLDEADFIDVDSWEVDPFQLEG